MLLRVNIKYHNVSIGFSMVNSTVEAWKSQHHADIFTGDREGHWGNIINNPMQELQHNNIMEVIMKKINK